MINSLQSAMIGYSTIYNALPVAIKAFIGMVLFFFLVTIAWKLLWRIKG